MKKMKTRTKLVGAVAALTVAVALSAGTTFAWFTTNATSTIGSIDATIKSGGDSSVYVAVGHNSNLTQTSFSSGLTASDLTDYISSNLDALTFATTIQDSSTGAIQFVDVDENEQDETVSTSTSSYIKIPITVKTDEPGTVYMTQDSEITGETAVSTTVTAWAGFSAENKYSQSIITDGGDLTAYAKNAARVGFTEVLDTSAGSTPTYGGVESSVKVWSPNEANYDAEEVTATKAELATVTVDRTSVRDDTSSYNWWANNLAGDYYASVKGGTVAEQVQYTNAIAPDATTYDGDTVTNADSAAAFTTYSVSGSEEGYAYIYIYVWIEGTDGDCFNNILEQTFSVTIVLTADTKNIAKVTGGD